ncbi:hypothetical protein EVB79_050 [Rhizobium phage RHph_N3_13]|nr:hypothetical protein EVB79_050 [Rhizobium phage RHph_N3_13]QIG69876.1 hypothetical protein F67_I3_11_050 [Rhizobium phage RHph_I3_11]
MNIRINLRMNRIFVFGSNLAGRHGKGAALHALKYYGAELGNGHGLQGNSYAIPTKDYYLRPLSVEYIKGFCEQFVEYARAHPHLEFDLTPVGCGLAGYTREEIRPFFKDAPSNVYFTKEWDE